MSSLSSQQRALSFTIVKMNQQNNAKEDQRNVGRNVIAGNSRLKNEHMKPTGRIKQTFCIVQSQNVPKQSIKEYSVLNTFLYIFGTVL